MTEICGCNSVCGHFIHLLLLFLFLFLLLLMLLRPLFYLVHSFIFSPSISRSTRLLLLFTAHKRAVESIVLFVSRGQTNIANSSTILYRSNSLSIIDWLIQMQAKEAAKKGSTQVFNKKQALKTAKLAKYSNHLPKMI